MTEESQTKAVAKKISIILRILYLFGALLYLGIAYLMTVFTSGLERLNWIDFIIYGTLFGICILGAGFTSIIFARKIFMSAEHRGWMKKTLVTTTVLSFVLFVFLLLVSPSLQFGTRANESAAKSNLHNMFLACQYYWEEEGDDKICDHNIASQEKYGYAKIKAVGIAGKGTARDFTATAQHEKTSTVFTINAEGKITEVNN